jgi:para-aminobenzoate synthetase / 4-amino-4-deoxychorismate lyase
VTLARFDDLSTGSAGSFILDRPTAELVATTQDEVRDVLAHAEAAAAAGRWVAGFVSYEAAPGLDASLTARPPDATSPFSDLPLAWFGVFLGRVAVPPPDGSDPMKAPDGRRGAEDAEAGPERGRRAERADAAPDWRPSVGREHYIAAIERIRELIASGETYQVNHTLRLRTMLGARMRTDEGLKRLYGDLAVGQRGAYCAYLSAGRFRVLSASPELFFEWERGRLVTRPMKGTAARGRWAEEDDAVARALRSSSKDRAENAMIVDLLRNDLGRMAIPGTVVADALFEIERYETVWQMTSTVSAEITERRSLVDVFTALFPSGSVTGAPKVASMRAIADLEDARRGVYTGAVGVLAPPASGAPRARFGVGIRTLVVDAETGVAEYGVGAGITFGSRGDTEYREVEAKSRVLFERRPPFELFETLAFEPTRGYRHVEEHLGRLSASARYFGFALDVEAVRIDLEKLAADAVSPVRVRLALARGGSTRVAMSPLPAGGSPVRLAILEDDPVDPQDVWLFHKTTRRAPYERRRRRRPDVDDVLLVNRLGRVTESTIANLVVRLDGSWWTPPIADGLLPGTYRAVLLANRHVRERSITLADVRGADEVALISSVRGWRSAKLLD